MPGNYGFCGIHRGRKQPKPTNKAICKPCKPKPLMKGTAYVRSAASSSGCRPSAAALAAVGVPEGFVVRYDGKNHQLKFDCNGRAYWSTKVDQFLMTYK